MCDPDLKKFLIACVLFVIISAFREVFGVCESI